VAGFDAPELSDDAPLAIWAEMEGLLVVMKLPHMAYQMWRISNHNTGQKEGLNARARNKKQHQVRHSGNLRGILLTHERELEIRALSWRRGTKIAGHVGAVLRNRDAVLVPVG
jgi:hypothetical protein